MTKREKRMIAVIFLFFLLIAGYQDSTTRKLQQDGSLQREDSGGQKKEVSLILNAEGILEDYEYELIVEPAKVTKEEAEELFAEAIKKIEKDFETYTTALPISKNYCEELVKAKWKFADREYVDMDGEIIQEHIPKEGVVSVAEVTLSCGEYEQIFSFPIRLQKRQLSKKEALLEEITKQIRQQSDKEGQTKIQLPAEVNGVSLEWTEKKTSMTLQVLFLEIVGGVLLLWGRKKQKEEEERRRIQTIEMGYPDVVNQFAMLIETGMTTRLAWKSIAAQYEKKLGLKIVERDYVMDAVVTMSRRLQEGEGERVVYEKFEEEVNANCYRRLMRTLVRHLDKGTIGLSMYLTEECRRAYEQRILTAKKAGEEASTKMLLPLMLMLIVVMAIVLLPAIIEITG